MFLRFCCDRWRSHIMLVYFIFEGSWSTGSRILKDFHEPIEDVRPSYRMWLQDPVDKLIAVDPSPQDLEWPMILQLMTFQIIYYILSVSNKSGFDLGLTLNLLSLLNITECLVGFLHLLNHCRHLKIKWITIHLFVCETLFQLLPPRPLQDL